jgi:hypothetical protein
MAGLLPRISVEPAPGYVPFVESHLATLRRDARRLSGDESIADEVSSGALTDVALRWQWFELLRMRLGHPDPAGAFLNVALARRCARRLREPEEVQVEVAVDIAPAPQAQSVAAGWAIGWPSNAAIGWYSESDVRIDVDPLTDPTPWGTDRVTPTATSAAVRLAKVSAGPPPAPSAFLEAVIAWLHAYETYIRYRRIVAATIAVIVVVVLTELGGSGAAF